MKLDHVAIEVTDLDEHIRQLVDNCGMRLLRMGARFSTGQRIAMLGDGTGSKLELIESTTISEKAPAFAHLAFHVEDASAEADRLDDAGWTKKRDTHRLDAARAETALLTTREGLDVQVIAYDSDSPDDVRWND